jgi:hypothetical protein
MRCLLVVEMIFELGNPVENSSPVRAPHVIRSSASGLHAPVIGGWSSSDGSVHGGGGMGVADGGTRCRSSVLVLVDGRLLHQIEYKTLEVADAVLCGYTRLVCRIATCDSVRSVGARQTELSLYTATAGSLTVTS